MDGEGVHDEHLTGRRSGVAASAGALVDLPEIGHIEAEVGPDRGREALSRARNPSFRGDHRDIHDRAPWNGLWGRRQANGGVVHHEREDCGCRAAGGAQGGLAGLPAPVLVQGMTQRPGRRPRHVNLVRSSVDFDPPGAQTLGRTGNSVTVCENRISVAGGADPRTIRVRRRGGHLRTTGGVVAGPGIRRRRGTDRHGAAGAGGRAGDKRQRFC